MSECGKTCILAPDVVSATYAPHEVTPRELVCEQSHPHRGPHTAEGWSWLRGQIWRTDQCDHSDCGLPGAVCGHPVY
jgi:hypothetical protein